MQTTLKMLPQLGRSVHVIYIPDIPVRRLFKGREGLVRLSRQHEILEDEAHLK